MVYVKSKPGLFKTRPGAVDQEYPPEKRTYAMHMYPV